MSERIHTFKGKAEVWLYPGMAAWHFISIPRTMAIKIKKQYEGLTRGWGSLKVKVVIGDTSWKTSIFPDNKTNTYLLPLKAEVRKKEKISAGTKATFKIEILT